MRHMKCNGRIFVDRVFSEKQSVELFCIGCGKRYILDKEKNKFAAWLWKLETAHANALVVS